MKNILDKWPTLSALATDIGLPYPTVAAWPQRGMIPARYDAKIVEAAAARGIDLSLTDIAKARAEAFEQKQASQLTSERGAA